MTLAYRYPDGYTSDTLVLDSRTGEVRSRTRDLEDRWTSYVGDRAIETVVMPHTEGFTYPGWEDDAETNAYRWTDIRENNVSLLPPGTMEGQSDTAQDFRGGLLVGYCPRETLDENGNYLRYATGYLLLTADGATYDLPGPAQGRGADLPLRRRGLGLLQLPELDGHRHRRPPDDPSSSGPSTWTPGRTC